MPHRTVEPTDLRAATDIAYAAPVALLAVGMPSCPSCELLTATLGAVADARPDLTVALAALATPEEWADRETLLWPRGIHVSRASVPTLVVLRAGDPVAIRHGGGPAWSIDEWLTEHLGPATTPIARHALVDAETEGLERVADLRARLLGVRAARTGTSG